MMHLDMQRNLVFSFQVHTCSVQCIMYILWWGNGTYNIIKKTNKKHLNTRKVKLIFLKKTKLIYICSVVSFKKCVLQLALGIHYEKAYCLSCSCQCILLHTMISITMMKLKQLSWQVLLRKSSG